MPIVVPSGSGTLVWGAAEGPQEVSRAKAYGLWWLLEVPLCVVIPFLQWLRQLFVLNKCHGMFQLSLTSAAGN